MGRIDLEHVLKDLSSYDQEINWDDHWGTLEVIDASYSEWIPRLRKALDAETDVAKLYALGALQKIGINPQELIPEAVRLLKDNAYCVRFEAMKLIASCHKNTPETTKGLVEVIKNSREYLGLRLRALWLLAKVYTANSSTRE